MSCNMCKERGQTWNGGAPQCAFEDGGVFSPDNWNCATVNAIRDICYEGQDLPYGVDYQYCEDQKYATIKTDGIEDMPMALWVSWYKSRGGTEAMWLLDNYDPPRQPTEQECVDIIEAYKQQARKEDGR